MAKISLISSKEIIDPNYFVALLKQRADPVTKTFTLRYPLILLADQNLESILLIC
jgi:hypothetical protein